MVQWAQQRRVGGNPLGGDDRARQLRVGEVPHRRAPHHRVPPDADRVVEAHPHEAVVQPDRPALRSRHARQGPPGQLVPPIQQGRA